MKFSSINSLYVTENQINSDKQYNYAAFKFYNKNFILEKVLPCFENKIYSSRKIQNSLCK